MTRAQLRTGWIAGLSLASAVAAAYQPPVELCRFADPRIDESSGLATSARTDDWVFTQNDSGGAPVVYAVDAKGETLASIRIKDALNLDWEDLAEGPDEAGKPSLFIADVGDNLRFRPVVWVYRVPEPNVSAERRGEERVSGPPVRFDFRYEDGPHDAETLLVHPKTGRIYLVTKDARGSGVYAGPEKPAAKGVNLLRKIADISFNALPAPPGRTRTRSPLATGGDFSPDGGRVVIRTYTDAYEWEVRDGDLAAAFKTKPAPIALPNVPLGEAIAYRRNGRALLTSTEGARGYLHLLNP